MRFTDYLINPMSDFTAAVAVVGAILAYVVVLIFTIMIAVRFYKFLGRGTKLFEAATAYLKNKEPL